MPVSDTVTARLKNRGQGNLVHLRRGESIFTGEATHYPRDFDGFIGQAGAKLQIEAHIASATNRRSRLDHILLETGLHGVGKTTLAHIIAYQAGKGLVTISGPVTVDDMRRILSVCFPGDIVFWDEMHTAVSRSRTQADFMLPLLLGNGLVTTQGIEPVPDVTFIGATTEVGKLPQTIISRFRVRPRFVRYTPADGALLVDSLSGRMDVPVRDDEREPIARAANYIPRNIENILVAVRDLPSAPGGCTQDGKIDINMAFDWAGFSEDGLTHVAQDMLLVLADAKDSTMSIDGIRALLGEPGTLHHHEQLLLEKGFITVEPRGRKLTDAGATRALQLVATRL